MRTKFYLSSGLSVLFFLFSMSAFAQTFTPEKIMTPIAFDKSKALRDIEPVHPGYRDRSWKDKVIPNKDGFLEEFNNPSTFSGLDPVLQDYSASGRSTATIAENFAGVPNLSGVAPPDTDGDVGPNHYMQMVNLAFQIFDKNGNSLYGPADNSTLWDGFTGAWTGTNDGDPIVLYDEEADRWLVSQFALPNYPRGPFYELIAVSATSDPTGEWHRYAYEFPNMPDYPKFGIWPDGYYFTINQFAPPRLRFAGAGVCVVDRDAMLVGGPASMVFFNLPNEGSILPADFDGAAPPAGAPNYLATLYTNGIKLLEAHIDWSGSSTIQDLGVIPVQPFSYSGITINQPGTSQTLDPMSTRLMYRLQYRNFGAYEVLMTNHTVNANGNGQAGVRWYEFRNSVSGWYINQQGTYAPADGIDRWMGSVAMNGNGDIAVGYSASSSSTYPSIRVAGQTAANSIAGILDVAETSIKEGIASQSGVNRWGDYSMMSVDPVDDNTFWYTQEYSNGGWNWRTQIASFNFGAPVVIAPVADFIGNPTIVYPGGEVSFTDMSQNNPTSWSWSFPGGIPSTSNEQNPTVVYPDLGPYNVTLTATNTKGSDTETKIGYINVISAPPPAPVADFYSNITSIEEGGTVQFYDNSQNNPTSWAWDFSGGVADDPNAPNPLVTFATAGTYTVSLTATNDYGFDEEIKPNYITVTPAGGSGYCSSNSEGTNDWIAHVLIAGIDNTSLESNYTDYTDQTATLAIGSSVSINLTPGFSGSSQKEFWRVWIDYNGDGDFEDSGETVFVANNKKSGVSGSFTVLSSTAGTTRMRVTMKRGSSPGPCETFSIGEVEDYTVSFTSAPALLERTQDLDISLYPNPAGNEINVEITSGESAVKLRLYSALGVILDELDTRQQKVTLDLGKYGPGVYYIGAENSSQTALKKFIKN